MAILYKNFYKQTIFTEVNETLGSSGPKMTAENVEPIATVEANIMPEFRNPLLNNNSNIINDNEGFARDSALDDAYNTNGQSNA